MTLPDSDSEGHLAHKGKMGVSLQQWRAAIGSFMGQSVKKNNKRVKKGVEADDNRARYSGLLTVLAMVGIMMIAYRTRSVLSDPGEMMAQKTDDSVTGFLPPLTGTALEPDQSSEVWTAGQVRRLLLLLSNDVESNPGPTSPTEDNLREQNNKHNENIDESHLSNICLRCGTTPKHMISHLRDNEKCLNSYRQHPYFVKEKYELNEIFLQEVAIKTKLDYMINNTAGNDVPTVAVLEARLAKNKTADCRVPPENETQRHALSLFGHTHFTCQEQKLAIENAGKCDMFVKLPTGSGKSIIYQLPPMFERKQTVIVVSPLISLMQDQLASLRTHNIPASVFDGSVSNKEREKIHTDLRKKHPTARLVYVTPEQTVSHTFKNTLNIMNNKQSIMFIAIDEAHCISEWGDSFRPVYKKLGEMRQLAPDVKWVSIY